MWKPPNPQTDYDRDYLRALFPLFEAKQFPKDFEFPQVVDPNYVPPINTFYCFVTGLIFVSATCCVSLLRFWIRARGAFGVDDWVMLAAFFSYCCFNVVNIVVVFDSGIGYHLYDNSIIDIYAFLVCQFLHVIFYFMTLNLARCSILHLFLRLSHLQSPKQQRYLWFVNGLSYIYGIASVLFEIFQCGLPVGKSFSLQAYFDGSCIGAKNLTAYGLFIGGHIILDALTIFPPMYVLGRLPLAPGKKFNLIFLLILGVFTMVASSIRLYVFFRIMVDSYDITWNATGVAFWGIVESSVALIIVSLPALNQTLLKWFRRIVNGPSEGNTRGTITAHAISIFERRRIFRRPNKTGTSITDTVTLTESANTNDAAYVELGSVNSESQAKAPVTTIEERRRHSSISNHSFLMQRNTNESLPDFSRTFDIAGELEMSNKDLDKSKSGSD